MNFRSRQYVKINTMLKKGYHEKVRRGEGEVCLPVYREINSRIVGLFAHSGLISHEMAEILGHKHEETV